MCALVLIVLSLIVGQSKCMSWQTSLDKRACPAESTVNGPLHLWHLMLRFLNFDCGQLFTTSPPFSVLLADCPHQSPKKVLVWGHCTLSGLNTSIVNLVWCRNWFYLLIAFSVRFTNEVSPVALRHVILQSKNCWWPDLIQDHEVRNGGPWWMPPARYSHWQLHVWCFEKQDTWKVLLLSLWCNSIHLWLKCMDPCHLVVAPHCEQICCQWMANNGNSEVTATPWRLRQRNQSKTWSIFLFKRKTWAKCLSQWKWEQLVFWFKIPLVNKNKISHTNSVKNGVKGKCHSKTLTFSF